MHDEAIVAGFYELHTWGRQYPNIKLKTLANLLAGKKVEIPPIKQVGATFKKAPKVTPAQGE
jgi:hypothetical protein